MQVNARTLLIIDDSPTDKKIYRRFLENWAELPLKIFEAGSGKAALEALNKQTVDMIILDYRLRDTTGIELIEGIRALSAAPVLFVTGQPEALTQTQAYRLGVAKYLSKDFISSQVLREAILETLKVGPS